ncbi:translation initiation factor eIF-2B subunit epsilon isoform X2 [Hyalella azteca]|uniref:Translation initiation factor eIF2B subunit epsilon n=1 Tax=Hyalella azteca TaxID=294128 RepID=A0A8B7N548_HYAAZ|nr:translation initiation factor eIF-2B subunit epsilon isoform X2 [Hyalella azteca]
MLTMSNFNSDFQRKEILQAVIYGDDFTHQFDPSSGKVHKLLLPLVNTPLVDYSLDWLHHNGVEEVIIYCKDGPASDEIKRHCKSVIERRNWKSMSVRVFSSADVRSLGAAVRDLYAKNIILGDFLLLKGDTLSNLNIRKLMDAHKAHKTLDNKAVMTCIFMPAERPWNQSSSETIRCSTTAPQSFSSLRVSTVATLDGKILAYQRHRRGTGLSFPSYLAFELPRALVSAQLGDPCMSVCSVELLGLFADNFDCMTSDSLVKGLLQPDDLNDCAVYQHIPKHGYAANITTFKDYEKVSLDMLRRVFTPLVPETSCTSGRRRYAHDGLRQHYWAPSSSLGYQAYHEPHSYRLQSAHIGVQVVLGEGVQLSPKARVRSSVLGNHCIVAEDASLDCAFLGDHCNIGAGCVLTRCFLGANVTLKPNTVLAPGCVVATDVTLGPDVRLECGSLVTSAAAWQQVDEFERDDTQVERVSENGLRLLRPEGERDEGLKLDADGQHLPIWGLRDDDFLVVEEADDSTTDGDELDGPALDDNGDVLDEDEQKELEFDCEVLDSLCNGVKSKTEAGKVVLEINASRYAYNIPLENMQRIVFKNVLLCHERIEGRDDTWPAWPNCKRGLALYQPVLERYFKSASDYLNTIESLVEADERVLSCAVKLLFELTQQLEVLDDGELLAWFEAGGKTPTSPSTAFCSFKEKVAGFLTWLQTAEEESEED